ncbi:T9SS type B sorting domain-containing protein, partial [Sphingobacterium sp. MYb382]|uniref:T9SS type B sorting domain-containing protein n=1 Tax=Sphingobacterium sp. MYb382 TaxID=2745278 RepID=UPI0030B53742
GLWTIGDLDVDQEAQLTIRALVLETGDTNNVADVESDTQDNELDNNQSAIFITVTNLLVANDDTPASINGKDGGTTVSVLDNDTLNGNVVDPTEVSLTPGVSPHANITMNGDGAITVTPETPAGTYFYPYSICEVLNPTNCSSAEVTIVVDAALLVANDDTPASINGKDGGTTVSVLDNDTLNGNVVDPTEVSLTPGVSPHANITMNGDGTITVTPETPAGTYFYPYSICEVLNPTNCSSAEVTIVVDAALLVANDDTPAGINGKDGGTTVSVLDNDTLNGTVVNSTEVSLTPGVSPHANITMNGDGTITVTPETPAGTYFYPYTICEVLNPTNCSSAEATIVVDAALLVANDDTPASINGKDGGTTVSVLDNDTLNGTAVDPTEVSLTPGVSPHANITMNGDGTITIIPETPAGTYFYPYTICEVLNPTNCSSAEVTIVVDAALLVANDDTPASINGKDGGTTVSVLDNDTLNGTAVDPTEVSLTPGVSPHANITMNGDGTITVTPETPAGTYIYPYKICEVLNPTNCSTANVTVTVTAGTLVANDDTPASINGKDGGTTVSVLNNDTLNGKVVNSTEVSLTPGVSPHANITMNGDGTITVTPETPAGTYIYPYTICDVLNPTNCSTANVTITVTAALIKANDDTPILINGKDGGITVSVLENDTLNGKVVKPAEVHLRPGVSPNAGFTMNGDGTVTVAPKTPAGTYTYPYTICEVLNPTNCSTAEVRIVVELIEIIAEDDTFEPINGENGGTTLSVLANDRLNLQVVNPADIKLTWLDSAPAGLTLNPEGTITVRPGTAQGTHTIRYRICELLNPNNCDEAIATVTVAPAPIIAVNDAYKVAWSQESIVMETVLKNDKFNNGAVNLDKVTLVPGVSSNPGLFMNPDGTIMALPGTRPGTYTYTYTICEVLNPNNCSSATATITIEASSLFIPNVFTPNGDGVNDVFEIIGLENYDKLSLTILNRWGNEVYRSEKYNNSWAGRGLNEGTYFYIIKLYKDDQFEVMKGWVLIKK